MKNKKNLVANFLASSMLLMMSSTHAAEQAQQLVEFGSVSDLANAEIKYASPTTGEETNTEARELAARVIEINGFDGAEPVIPGLLRIFRNTVSSTCPGAAKVFPGTNSTVAPGALYDAYTLFNNGPARCITVVVNTGTCGTAAHFSAYSGTFDPTNIATNYLGDLGSSVSQPFSFMAPANSPIVIVASTNFGPTVCNYSFDADLLDRNQQGVNIPIFSPVGLLVMISMLGLYGFKRKEKA